MKGLSVKLTSSPSLKLQSDILAEKFEENVKDAFVLSKEDLLQGGKSCRKDQDCPSRTRCNKDKSSDSYNSCIDKKQAKLVPPSEFDETIKDASVALHSLRDSNPIFSASTSHDNPTNQTSVWFPDNFIWGAATAAYQIEGGVSEGGRGPSIWDTFCMESPDHCNGDTGNVAADHFHLWQQDIDLMHSLGLKAYRFSISWSRILPTGTAEGIESGDHRFSSTKGINYDGVQFYNNIIDALIEKGIQPFVTIYHWDLPQALQDKYSGWESRQIIEDFAKYARICFQFFGDRVKYWITINEAWTVAVMGYDKGIHAPGLINEQQGGTGQPYVVAHNLLLAHARAVGVYREEGYANWYLHGSSNTKGMIGISNSGGYNFPLDPKSQADRDAANISMEFGIGWLVRSSPFYLLN